MMKTTVEEINSLIKNKNIVVEGFRDHSKASERYIDVTIQQDNGYVWKGSIPYYYRRTGLFIETPKDLAEYLDEIYPYFSKDAISKFIEAEKERWENQMGGRLTTKAFFDKLINLEWNSVEYDLPKNPNFARRIQDIKEYGYTLATNTRMRVKNKTQNDTHILLVPLPKGGVTGYEVMSQAFKSKVITVLNFVNSYELSNSNKHGLLPDHKFPEIRWDDKTKAENSEDMSELEIKSKFQLIDNQRNQQKREVCRKCFQTNKRGTLFGINYYYQGDENWPAGIPKIGKEAEKGCIGCGWYDIQKWRETLNGKIGD